MTTTTPTTGSSVSVSAYGTASEQVYPHMQLLMNGILLGEWDVTGSSQNYTADVSGRKLYYYHSDHLGSSRLLTDANGNVVWQGTFLPYGYEYSPQGSVNNYKFTSFERDAESQLDHAWFRQYAPHMGRWMSPDPAGLAAVDPTNPQTWNRYGYVDGNPVNSVDPLGLMNCPSVGTSGTCDATAGSGGGGPIPYGMSYYDPNSDGGVGRNPGYCPSWYPYCGWGIGTAIGIGIDIGSGGGGTSGGGSSGGRSTGGGETLGLPNGYDFKPLNIWQLMGLQPIESWCDFGPCVFGMESTSVLGKRLANCALDQVGLRTAIGGVLVVSGLPTLGKPFVTEGATEGTSLASKTLGKVFPQRLKRGVWAPTLKHIGARSPVVGRVLGRWVPIVGWGMLAYDVAGVGLCMWDKRF